MYNNFNPYYNSYNIQPQIMGQPVYSQAQASLPGKTVDSIDVVRATAAPLDGSILYFPLTDGSAIITKKLQMDGTSQLVRYEPVKDDTPPTPTLKDMQVELDDLKAKMDKVIKDMQELKVEEAN